MEADEHCPSPRGETMGEPNTHCSCWYEGDECCRCLAPAMTDEQKEAAGME